MSLTIPRTIGVGRCLTRLENHPREVGVDPPRGQVVTCLTRLVNHPQGRVAPSGGWVGVSLSWSITLRMVRISKRMEGGQPSITSWEDGAGRCLTTLVNHPQRWDTVLTEGWVGVSLDWSVSLLGGTLRIDMRQEGCLVFFFFFFAFF